MPTFGVSPTCPVCQQKVYFAEEVKCLNNSYHKLCLKCSSCSKTLDSSTVNDHNGSIYCRVCYGKNFGPKGYGYASEASSRSNRHLLEEPPSPLYPPNSAAGGEKCSRCQSTVYFNERVQASGRVFHRSCFKCADCGKPLEAGGESEHKGEVYCRGCYARSYGTKGFCGWQLNARVLSWFETCAQTPKIQ
uniref:LIM zinc-binding domain-containing protein n=1 Tax=Macrostomum lignano TaxID=282301 RepID=A0A1I8HFE3_9PLAT